MADQECQSDAPTANIESYQHDFRIAIKKGVLTPGPSQSFYVEWSIFTNPVDIDGPKEDDADKQPSIEENSQPHSSDDEEDEKNEPDPINSIEESGQELNGVDSHSDLPTNHSLPQPILPESHCRLKGYEYTEFIPTTNQDYVPDMALTQSEAMAALQDLKKILHPQRDTGRGYKDPELDLWRQGRLNGMVSMLNMFTNTQSLTYNKWGASAYQTAIGMGWGTHCARWLCALNQAFFSNRELLPINPYGDWNKSLLVDENIVNEVNIYLMSLGKEISAKKLMDFFHQADIKEKYGIDGNISHKTACRYLHTLGYCYQSTPKGQYVDGHERDDVVMYRKKYSFRNGRYFCRGWQYGIRT